eukprot:TRINITY_DN5124_c0_g1_i1.p1 TRINITY_DN5124_c0_g1~~TRINITY_DN5124_c0_g1_i1.p1  ORF type:complete len:443 (-),score=103.53 TRINITY_DN5124_c0_g1_i1:110-1411(-)
MRRREYKDCSDLVEEEIPKLRDLAAQSFGEAFEGFLALEKKTRQSEDAFSTGKVLVAVVEVCFEHDEAITLLNNIVLFSKRRGQLKEAIKMMVKKTMEYLDSLEKPLKLDFISILIQVSEGKIFVEKERARLTRILANIRESEGNIEEAARIIQEVQVETYGAMKKREKTEFIIEQMRLCLAMKDYIRTQIISRKINPKVLLEEEFQSIKIQYYTYMVEYYSHENQHIEICKAYQKIYDTPIIKEDIEQSLNYLKLIVLFVSLSEHDNEQSDLMNRIYLDPLLDQIPEFKELVKKFLTDELIQRKEIAAHYRDEFLSLVTDEELWEVLIQRILDHNIHVISKYYSQITTQRLSELLDLDPQKTEDCLCKLVVKKAIYAKVDRFEGIVSFIKQETTAETLNNWNQNISELLNLVESTCHMIHRENMIHGLVVDE